MRTRNRMHDNRARMLLDQAKAERLRGRREETTAGAGVNEGDVATMATEPIQDEDGNLIIMCGVSRCGGDDVCGP